MVDECAHLAQVDRQIADAKEHIRKQERLIKRLTVRGRNLDEAESFLSILIGTLKALEQHRLLVLDRLYTLSGVPHRELEAAEKPYWCCA